MNRHAPLLLVLAILLGAVAPAVATAAHSSPAPAIPHAVQPTLLDAELEFDEDEEIAEEEGEDEEDFALEECTGEDLEFEEFDEGDELEAEELELEEECGEERAEVGNRFVTSPAACLVRRAESTVATMPGSDSLLLTVRYATYSPTQVSVGLKLKDRKGNLALDRSTAHLNAGGTLHLTTKVGEAALDRAAAADEFDVSLRAPHTPAYCGNLLEQELQRDGGDDGGPVGARR